ncbi:hypothetical protein ACRAWD_23735 [Caulobacter segnis]
MILYERIAALMDAAIPDIVPDTGGFDEGEAGHHHRRLRTVRARSPAACC